MSEDLKADRSNVKNQESENPEGMPAGAGLQREGTDGGHTEEPRLEELLAQVESCIKKLEDPQIPLEDSFRYYEEGVRKLKSCSSRVEQIEQKMLVINSQGALENFDMS